VRKHLELTYIPNNGKSSKVAHLKQVWKVDGEKPEELVALEPDIPPAGQDIWEIFWELKTGEHITWSECLAYSYLYNIRLQPDVIQILIAMNATYNKFIYDKEKPKNTGGK
jgi:hypothetical protein